MALPLAVKAAFAKPTTKPQPLKDPLDYVGLWIHVECGPRKDYIATFARLEQFIRSKTKRERKWLTQYVSHFSDNLAQEGMAMRAFRQKAIEGNTIAVKFVNLPPSSSKPINHIKELAGLPSAAYYLADIITYHDIDGSVQFLKCRWSDPQITTQEYAEHLG